MRRLDDEVLNDIAVDYVQTRLYKTNSQPEPIALIIAGQPGSGKSTVATELEETLAVCVYMGGGPALMYTAEALKAWDTMAAAGAPAAA